MPAYRLPMKIKSAQFKTLPRKGFTAFVKLSLEDTSLLPMPFPTDFEFTLTGENASNILEAGRNGLISASLKADEDTSPEDWKLGAVIPT